MSSQYSLDGAIEAIRSSDLARLRTALAAAERHLQEYGDVAILAQAMKSEIAKLEKRQG